MRLHIITCMNNNQMPMYAQDKDNRDADDYSDITPEPNFAALALNRLRGEGMTVNSILRELGLHLQPFVQFRHGFVDGCRC
mmetsp:Transcript_23253/g.56097  ORF Transcript_23253/g.56097 Transcript_23253/m.56097 type:complete len:81 (+) Transcript_23253:2016-2258(+)